MTSSYPLHLAVFWRSWLGLNGLQGHGQLPGTASIVEANKAKVPKLQKLETSWGSMAGCNPSRWCSKSRQSQPGTARCSPGKFLRWPNKVCMKQRKDWNLKKKVAVYWFLPLSSINTASSPTLETFTLKKNNDHSNSMHWLHRNPRFGNRYESKSNTLTYLSSTAEENYNTFQAKSWIHSHRRQMGKEQKTEDKQCQGRRTLLISELLKDVGELHLLRKHESKFAVTVNTDEVSYWKVSSWKRDWKKNKFL